MSFDSTGAIDSPGSGSANLGTDKPPISAHPGFPAVVALWFAALLGLGSLILPVILLERAIESSGIAAMLPAASPPLGLTARILIAAIGAVLGAGLGLALARRVASAQAPSGRAPVSSGATLRPISAHDELGNEGLGAEIVGTTRRRPLTLADDDRAGDEYLWLAPLPGDDRPAEASEPAAEPDLAEPDLPEPDLTEPFELSELAESEHSEPARFVWPEPTTASEAPDAPLQPQDATMTDGLPAQFPTSEERERRLNDRRTGKPGAGPAGNERRLFLRRGGDEPLPFAAPSFGRRAPADNENMLVQQTEAATEAPAPADSEHEVAAQDEPTTMPTPADWATGPLDTLGMVQLVQRLAASLEKRRQLMAEPVAPAPLQPAVPADFEAAPPEQAAQAMAAYFGRGPEATADAAWLDGQGDDEFDWADSFARQTAKGASPEPIVGADEDGQEAEPDAHATYGSLLNLAGSPERAFEPSDAPADPVQPSDAEAPLTEADEALRKAIATLQRMSSHG